jgi:hypothetical protein
VLELPGSEAASRVGELEWPQEVACLLEVGTDREDLVDQVFHADDAVLSEVVLNELVVGQSNALLVDLAISTLVDQLSDRLQVGVAIGDVGVDDGEHLLCGLGELDEDTVVDLKKTQKLEDLAGLRSDLVDTVFVSGVLKSAAENLPLDANDKDKLGLLFNVERPTLSGYASESDLLTLCISVLLDVGLSVLEDDLALLLVLLLQIVSTCLKVTTAELVWRCAQPRKMVNRSDNIDSV